MPGEMIREAAREITDSAERADLLLVVAYAYAPDATLGGWPLRHRESTDEPRPDDPRAV